jgi:hypothetical protein
VILFQRAFGEGSMKPRALRETGQNDLFKARLDQIEPGLTIFSTKATPSASLLVTVVIVRPCRSRATTTTRRFLLQCLEAIEARTIRLHDFPKGAGD